MIADRKLSEHFTLHEFLRSQTAVRKNISEQFYPSQEVINNLQLLCTHILEPLRQHYGRIDISSGYRCKALNKAIGSKAPNSQHTTGQAADLEAPNGDNLKLFMLIQELKLPFDQLINEYPRNDQPSWVHVSYSSKNRRQVLTIS